MEEYCQVFSLHTDILPFKRRTKISFPFAFYAESLLLREFDISSMQLFCFYQLFLCSFLASLAIDCMQ